MGRIVKSARVASDTYRVAVPRIEPPQPPHHGAAADSSSPDAQDVASFSDSQPFEQPPAAIDWAALHSAASELIERTGIEAEMLIRDAEARALDLISAAHGGAAEVTQAARADGIEAGRIEGREQIDAEMAEMIATLRELVESARDQRRTFIEGAEPEILKLAVDIAERILHREVALDENAVVEIARNALTRVITRERITVRVNPADAAALRRHREALLTDGDADHARIVEDQRVDRGGVVIETDAGTVDAKIATQLREARRLLHVEDESVGPAEQPSVLRAPAQAG